MLSSGGLDSPICGKGMSLVTMDLKSLEQQELSQAGDTGWGLPVAEAGGRVAQNHSGAWATPKQHGCSLHLQSVPYIPRHCHLQGLTALPFPVRGRQGGDYCSPGAKVTCVAEGRAGRWNPSTFCLLIPWSELGGR